MFIDTSHRSTASEMMDDFGMEGEILRDALDKIAHINRLLGGNKVTLTGLQSLLKQPSMSFKAENRVIRILDVGCGNGDMLRMLAIAPNLKGIKMELVGLDANAFTVKHAERLSASYANISYRCSDIFEELKPEAAYDIILCTLTLHHFSDADILRLLSAFRKQARIGIVINDLHRSALAYYLFKGLCLLFGLNDMSREDGLVSILRGFKKRDLEQYSDHLGIKKRTIKWKWAFRYQWIIRTL